MIVHDCYLQNIQFTNLIKKLTFSFHKEIHTIPPLFTNCPCNLQVTSTFKIVQDLENDFIGDSIQSIHCSSVSRQSVTGSSDQYMHKCI